MKMGGFYPVRSVVTMAVALLIAVWAVSARAGGPSAEETVGFLDQKFNAYGGGFTMTITADDKVQYTRVFPLSLSMPRDGQLIVEVAEQQIIESERLPAGEIDASLKRLESAGALQRRFEIPLEKMEFGSISSRRGDWRAQKTLKKSTGKIRILCQDKVNCIKINRQPDGYYVDLYVDDELQREKIFKALKHLVGLYQHRRELF